MKAACRVTESFRKQSSPFLILNAYDLRMIFAFNAVDDVSFDRHYCNAIVSELQIFCYFKL